MMDENELLFDELYEKTKDCGRTQFIRLLMQKERENQKLKEENQELKKQLEEKIKIGVADHKYASECEDKVITMENQQKEFIEYMNKTIEELECDDYDDEEMKGYLIQRIDIFKEILSKYKSIIGKDINVGTKGGKDEV